MKKLIFKSTSFLAGFFLLALMIQLLLFFAIRRIHIGDFGVLNAIANGMINTEMLICGSSRGYVHYNPVILEKTTEISCYNISANGSDLGVQLPILKWYLEKNRTPRFLVQNIDVFTEEIDPVIYEPFKFLPYLNNNSLFQGLSRIDKRWWLHKYIPCSNLIYFGKDFQSNLIKELYQSLYKKKDYLIRGYFPRKNSKFNDTYASDFLRRHAAGFHYSLSQAYKEYLGELINICRNHHIQLVLVICPEYAKFMALQTNRKEIIDYYVRLSQDNGLWFFDFSHSEVCHNREYFYNFTHMNSEGADKFSRELASELKKKIFVE